MQVEILPPDPEYNILIMVEVDDRYWIEVTTTIMASYRVMLRPKESMALMCNWCAGPMPIHILVLINAMIDIIHQGKEMDAPISSEVKPYYKDFKFCDYIKRHMNIRIPEATTLVDVGKVITI